MLGWSLRTEFPPSPKYVLIAAPHTSNWDFVLGILAVWALDLDVHWVGKHSLFHKPWGWFFRSIGGIPVYRDRTLNQIDQLARHFADAGHLILALAPEGTRSRTDHWKTGFYHIARAADVPIAMAWFDYGIREMGIGGSFIPGDDINEVFERVRDFYADIQARRPENRSPVRLRRN